MIIKKILIVPSKRLVQQTENHGKSLVFKSKYFINSLLKRNIAYDAELQWYGDIPDILGKNNVFMLGQIPNLFFSKSIPQYCPYPSCLGTSKPTFINLKQLNEAVKDVSAVLISSRSGERGKIAINEAKLNDIPVAILDFNDHESLYGFKDIENEIYRDFSFGKDFDFYFKKDLPIGYKKDNLIPLAPTPLRPSSYSFKKYNIDYDIFYSGTSHNGACQEDRIEGIELIKKNFANSLVIEHEKMKNFISTKKYWSYFTKSSIAFSPSGLSWDSFRHCEIGLTKTTVLFAPVPYIETVPPFLQDGVNAILYDTEIRGNKCHIKNKNSFIEKINYYLGNPSKLNQIASNWFEDVMNGHTVFSRSKYILESLENYFK